MVHEPTFYYIASVRKDGTGAEWDVLERYSILQSNPHLLNEFTLVEEPGVANTNSTASGTYSILEI